MKIASSGLPRVRTTSIRSGWRMPGSTERWYSQARDRSRRSCPHASASTRRRNAGANLGSSARTRNPSPSSWTCLSILIGPSSNADIPRISASASNRAATGSVKSRASAAASSWTSISICSSVVRANGSALLPESRAQRFLAEGVAVHLPLPGQEPRDADGDDDEDDVGHQRLLQPDRVADGPVDRNADRAGDEAEAHDEARRETRPRGHQLLRHQQHERLRRRGEDADEDRAAERPAAWKHRVEQDRGHAQHERAED